MKMLKMAVICALFVAPSTALAASNRPKVLIVGDSITYSGESYARLLGRVYPTTIIAKSGESTRWMRRRLKEYDLTSFTHLVILGGVNDLNGGGLEQAKRNLLKIYGQAKSVGLTVVAITVSPWKGWPSWTPSKHANTLRLNNWMRSQEGRNVDHVVDFYETVSHRGDPQRLAPEYDRGTDHLHPNKRAHRTLFGEVLRALRY